MRYQKAFDTVWWPSSHGDPQKIWYKSDLQLKGRCQKCVFKKIHYGRKSGQMDLESSWGFHRMHSAEHVCRILSQSDIRYEGGGLSKQNFFNHNYSVTPSGPSALYFLSTICTPLPVIGENFMCLCREFVEIVVQPFRIIFYQPWHHCDCYGFHLISLCLSASL